MAPQDKRPNYEHIEGVDSDRIHSPAESSLVDRYEMLVSNLAEIKEATDSSGIIPLEAARRALIQVLAFLNKDGRIVRQGLNNSLFQIYRAVHDLSQGGKPPLFYKQKLGHPKGGAPTHQSNAVARAQIVLSLEVLFKAGIPKEEASKWLAGELYRLGINGARGNRVQSKDLLRWYYEKGGKSPSGFDAAYERLEDGEMRRGWQTEPKEARKRAALLILRLKNNFSF